MPAFPIYLKWAMRPELSPSPWDHGDRALLDGWHWHLFRNHGFPWQLCISVARFPNLQRVEDKQPLTFSAYRGERVMLSLRRWVLGTETACSSWVGISFKLYAHKMALFNFHVYFTIKFICKWKWLFQERWPNPGHAVLILEVWKDGREMTCEEMILFQPHNEQKLLNNHL